MNKESISVVIPMYNAESTILSTLASIVNQTSTQYIKEIIVVNDGSEDKSREIVETFSNNSVIPVRLINTDNGGVSKARNTGMRLASGEWIAFCDADDIWIPDKIEVQTEIIDNNDVDLIGGNYLNSELSLLFKKISTLHKASSKELCIKMFPQTSTILMRKKIFDEIGGFDESMSHYEDGDYLLKIAAKYNYYYSPHKMVIYGGERACGGAGLSANTDKMNEGSIIALKHTYGRKEISVWFYLIMRLFYVLKRWRREILFKRNAR